MNNIESKRNIETAVFFHFCEFVHSLQSGGKIKRGENPNKINSLVMHDIKSWDSSQSKSQSKGK